MQLNKTTDYAFRTLLCLFRMEERVVQAEVIASEMNIPVNYLQHVIRVLKENGYVETVRGQHGGYKLSESAKELTAWDVLHLYEPEKIHRCLEDETIDDINGNPIYSINALFTEIQDQMDKTLKKSKIRQLADEADKKAIL